ncbi:phytoene desaturase family protein [Sulfuracidifex metallicus]|uniref:Pyridine nucleotide-disulfide oxidoreductase domain-containing protein 2 n=1 Tax=Sulfuracidifex metallicus DSM 6482 = JCM 9184 TaxID=523847 RepID=A0A6A9QJP3_SULME|nr:NAD(P)/FAD-dependent oxidoreductase [Sulfuracidifex metallicus]MUN29216.1 FAD-dependent oxidoreductase [Sulfuracidifex metallicus DSM 6482 = JCM 9184]WOE50265.1 NAD(P)/FAD-dependent oxidoreductase [Sulfuracidifex metallicus DSM 6482 = JCM 9184]
MRYDALIIGGGHNGLVASFYLARRGLKVAVLERREIVGGASVTEELWPGIRISTGAYVLSLLRPRIINEMNLPENGLHVYNKDPGLFLPLGRKNLFIWNDIKRTQKEIEKFSKKDSLAYSKWIKFWDTFYDLADFFMLTPPVTISDVGDLLYRFKGSIDEENLSRIGRTFLQDARSFLDEFFESDEVKSALIEDSVVGTFASPSTPGTAYVLAHHVIGEVNGIKGMWGYVKGGMGGVTSAMARACEKMGVDIMTSTEVEEILVKNGEVAGVKTKDGRIIESKIVLSNADPKTTFLKLVNDVDEEIRKRVSALKSKGVSFKVVGYTEELPDFGNGKSLGPEHVASELIMPNVDYIERAYDDARVLGYSREPWLSINFQTSVDPTVALPGKHVFSIFGQYLPFNDRLDDMKEKIAEITLEKVREYAPNFKPVKYEVITPLDIKRRFGIWEGNIFHIDMTPDQLYIFRPALGMSRYKTPIKGLYLCGSGTHPGGGVTGAPGYNAAHAVLNDLNV